MKFDLFVCNLLCSLPTPFWKFRHVATVCGVECDITAAYQRNKSKQLHVCLQMFSSSQVIAFFGFPDGCCCFMRSVCTSVFVRMVKKITIMQSVAVSHIRAEGEWFWQKKREAQQIVCTQI